jgi:Domain of unknown function (DUF4340)
MRSFRSIAVLGVLLVGLVAYLYFVDSKKPVDQAEEKAKVFAGLEADKIEEVKIDTVAGGTAVAQKAADGWKLVSPTPARADDSELSSITSNLASVTIERVVDEAPKNLGDYGLKEPVVQVSFKTKGAKNFRTLDLGTKTPTGSDMYARIDGEKKVFLVQSYLDSTFNRKPFDLRDKKVLNFDREKVDRVEIADGDKLVTLVKSGADWRVAAPVEARGDFGAIEQIVSRVQSAQMKSVVNEAATDLKEYGLDKPTTTVTVGLGSARAGLAIGKKADGGDLYARDVSKNQVVTIAADLLTDLQKGVTEYRRKDVFEFRPYNLTRLEVTRGADVATFERLKGKGKDSTDVWQNVKTKKAVDGTKFESFLAKLSGLRAQSFADAKTKTGLDTPVLVTKATYDDGKKTETVRFGREGTAAYSSRADEPGASALNTSELEELFKSLDGLK